MIFTTVTWSFAQCSLEVVVTRCIGTFVALETFILCQAGWTSRPFHISILLIFVSRCTIRWTSPSFSGLCSDPMRYQQNDFYLTQRSDIFVHLGSQSLYSFLRRHFAVSYRNLPALSRDFSPHNACRVGEASHPGPTATTEGYQTKLAFVNPTAVNKKVTTLLELKSDIIALAETSATMLVQQATTTAFRAHDYASLWSPPVAPHAATTREDAAFRGTATGVSIHTNWPIRPTRVEFPEEIDDQRIVSGIIELANLHIHIITIYGYPKPNRDAWIKTDKLLATAAKIADEVGLPSIIIGDFNHPPEKLYAGRAIMQYGYRTTADIYQYLHQETMPNTCREATCNDQAFIHPDLLQHVTNIQVNKGKLFGDHDPVEIDFSFPFQRPCKQIFRVPQTWMHFEPDKEKVAKYFEEFANKHDLPLENPDLNLLPDALKLWAMGVEESVTKAISEQHIENPDRFPQSFLPKKYLGRWKDPKISKIPPKVPIKQACAGQYTPAAEVVTYCIKMKTRQVRRLQSLRYRLLKVACLVNQFESTVHSLRAEWRAITRAKGFPNSFPSYCLTNPQLLYYPLDFPTVEWLDVIIRLLSQDIDAEIVLERQKHRQTSKFAQWYDEKKDHLQQAMRQVKQVVNPTMAIVPSEISAQATLIEDDFGLVTLQLSEHLPLRLDRLLSYAGFSAQIQNRQGKTITVVFLDHYESLPVTGQVVQKDLTSDPSKIADKLNTYWNQFWCRDSPEDTSKFKCVGTL